MSLNKLKRKVKDNRQYVVHGSDCNDSDDNKPRFLDPRSMHHSPNGPSYGRERKRSFQCRVPLKLNSSFLRSAIEASDNESPAPMARLKTERKEYPKQSMFQNNSPDKFFNERLDKPKQSENNGYIEGGKSEEPLDEELSPIHV